MALFQDPDFKALIIELNTIDQLYNHGIDSDGKKLMNERGLNAYSPKTVEIKKEKGQPTDRITLLDTGEFYASFKCKWVSDGDGEILITANTIKDETDLLVEWGQDILGLDEDSIVKLQNYARTWMTDIVRGKLKLAA